MSLFGTTPTCCDVRDLVAIRGISGRDPISENLVSPKTTPERFPTSLRLAPLSPHLVRAARDRGAICELF